MSNAASLLQKLSTTYIVEDVHTELHVEVAMAMAITMTKWLAMAVASLLSSACLSTNFLRFGFIGNQGSLHIMALLGSTFNLDSHVYRFATMAIIGLLFYYSRMPQQHKS